MTRINLVDPKSAQGEAAELLAAVQKKLGGTPNMMKALANSPKTLASYLALSGNLAQGAFDQKTIEQIALFVSERNGCDYCVSAHSAIGRKAGLSGEQLDAARRGEGADPRASAAINFAKAVVETRGEVSSTQLATARKAGLSDGELIEIVGHVALNILTNYVARLGNVDIDFPKASPLTAPAAACNCG